MSSTFNLKFLEEISAGDKDKLKRLMLTFLEEAPKTVIKLRDLYKIRNFDDMHMTAHAAKPLYLSIGADKASVIIKNLETYTRSAFFRELIPVEIEALDKVNNEICSEMSLLMQNN